MVLVSSQGGKRGWLEWGLEGGSSANDTIQASVQWRPFEFRVS